jgi:hypothetical protein
MKTTRRRKGKKTKKRLLVKMQRAMGTICR